MSAAPIYDLYFDPERGHGGMWVIEQNGKAIYAHSVHETAKAKLDALMGDGVAFVLDVTANDAPVQTTAIVVAKDDTFEQLAKPVKRGKGQLAAGSLGTLNGMTITEPFPLPPREAVAEHSVRIIDMPNVSENANYWHGKEGWYFGWEGTRTTGGYGGPFPLFIDAVIARWKT